MTSGLRAPRPPPATTNGQHALFDLRSEGLTRLLVESSGEGIFGIDSHGICRFINRTGERLLGAGPGEMLGVQMHDATHHTRVDGTRLAKADCPIYRACRRGKSTRVEEDIFWRVDGTSLPVAYSSIPMVKGDVVVGAVITFTDISEQQRIAGLLRESEERLHTALEASEDPLTGLPNRTLLVDRLATAFARRSSMPEDLVVFFIDLDRFRAVNDTLGQAAGDVVLKAIAGRLREAVREGDTVARFGGDEFVILCEDVGSAAVLALGDRLCELVALPVHVDERDVVITASIGVAIAPSIEIEHESLIRDADAAMYRAKERGRNRCEVFDSVTRTLVQARRSQELELRDAIEAGQLVVFYQPVMSMNGGGAFGAEALVRWQHPSHGLIAPAEFIPLAEQTGLIGSIGTWVLTEAFKEAATWPVADNGEPLRIAVNLSPLQLSDPSLPDVVSQAMDAAGLGPKHVVLEITESAVMADVRASARALALLRRLGVQLSIDDFGTGYSSLRYLCQFAVDALKIDRFFVSGLGQNSNDTAVVRAVLRLADELELVTIAEGVETTAQREQLLGLGCQLGQGHLWSPALAPSAFRDWISTPPSH